MMPQGMLPFQYQSEKNNASLTSFSGLPLYLEWMIASGLCHSTSKLLKTKSQGWTDLQIISSLILLNIAGGDCVDDIQHLEADAGLKTLLFKFETQGMQCKERRKYERRWRKKKCRALPSPSTILRYLEQFHNAEQEKLREDGVAFIPEQNALLQKLCRINHTLVNFAQSKSTENIATLDMDATLTSTHKRNSFFLLQKIQSLSANEYVLGGAEAIVAQ